MWTILRVSLSTTHRLCENKKRKKTRRMKKKRASREKNCRRRKPNAARSSHTQTSGRRDREKRRLALAAQINSKISVKWEITHCYRHCRLLFPPREYLGSGQFGNFVQIFPNLKFQRVFLRWFFSIFFFSSTELPDLSTTHFLRVRSRDRTAVR